MTEFKTDFNFENFVWVSDAMESLNFSGLVKEWRIVIKTLEDNNIPYEIRDVGAWFRKEQDNHWAPRLIPPSLYNDGEPERIDGYSTEYSIAEQLYPPKSSWDIITHSIYFKNEEDKLLFLLHHGDKFEKVPTEEMTHLTRNRRYTIKQKQ